MFERRLKLLLAGLCLVTLVLVARAFSIQVLHHTYWADESNRISTDDDILETGRGRILDVKGRALALDEACFDICVDYRVILFELEMKSAWSKDWLRAIARERVLRANDNFTTLPRSQRLKLINAEYEPLKHDIDAMWKDLAKFASLSTEEMNDKRREIIRLVSNREQNAREEKFKRANAQSDQGSDRWYSWLLGKTELSIDDIDVVVAEQKQAHVIIPNVSYEVRNQIARQIEQYPGLSIRSGVVRTYPYKAIASQTIGTLRKVDVKDMADREAVKAQTIEDRLRNYRATDDIGRSGLEASMEDKLRGARGLEVKDGDGNLVRQIKPIPGKDLQTTIDIELQKQIENAFNNVAFRPYPGEDNVEHIEMNGAAVVIDIPTGEVRALVSHPTYDLNDFDKNYAKLSRDVVNRPFANRALTSILEPGSTVKPIIGIAAVTDGLYDLNKPIECTGYLVIDGKTYSYGRCWTARLKYPVGHHKSPSDAPHPTGWLSFAEALERSCNVFHEELGDKLGIGGISMWFDKFGLGRQTGIELTDAKGRLPDQAQSVGPASAMRSIAWFAAIGQGDVLATPIQMANVAATIARDGIWVRPTLLHRTAFAAGDRADLHLNAAAVREARRGMVNVVNGAAGTGTIPRMKEFVVAGKTGSAQSAPLKVEKIDEAGLPVKKPSGATVREEIPLGRTGSPSPRAPWYRASGEDEDGISSHAWMIAYAPAENPKIAIAAMVEYGGSGGFAAGSIIKQTLEACIAQGYLAPGQR